MARRHAFYKMVALVQGTNIVRREHGVPEAECIAADPNLTLLNVKRVKPKAPKPTPAAAKASKKRGSKKAAKKSKRRR